MRYATLIVLALAMPGCLPALLDQGAEAMLYRDAAETVRYRGVPPGDVAIILEQPDSTEIPCDFGKIGTRVRVIDDQVQHPLAKGRRLVRIRVLEGPRANLIGLVDRDDVRKLPSQ